MERFDVAIIGGGSAGLAALKQLSNLEKQTVLLEAGKTVGSKNVSGGILYSKKPKNGKVYNVEDVYGDGFVSDAPLERLITKYILHATSKDKIFSIDLTSAHKYQANFGYSVLLNKLNSWIAEITGARNKFTAEELYQGVKVVVKLPEEIMEQRFEIGPNEGAAHLFAGDITLNHIGGGFVYTNRDTLSAGAVYHYDSLIQKPDEPYTLVNAILNNPMVKEFIKDEVAVKADIDKSLPKEEQLRTRFAVSKLVNTWDELRHVYYSPTGKAKLIESGKYKSETEIKARIDSLRQELSNKY